MPDGKPSALVTGALLVIGLLLLVPSGLCTGLMIVMSLSEGEVGMVLTALIVGGPFLAVGGLLFWVARKRAQRAHLIAETETGKTNPPPA